VKVYYNDRREIAEKLADVGFSDPSALRMDPAFRDLVPDGVQVAAIQKDSNDGGIEPPQGAYVEVDVPDGVLEQYELLADDPVPFDIGALGHPGRAKLSDLGRHAGAGFREFLVPASILNRYQRRLHTDLP
jgi:hypothetical protein